MIKIYRKIRALLAVFGVLSVCCLVIHRRVIKALIKGEPIPKAPKSHFWVKNREEK